MEATKAEVSEWFDRGLSIRPPQTHMFHIHGVRWRHGERQEVEYPAYAGSSPESINDCVKHYHNKNDQTVIAVYDLRLDKRMQLFEEKPWHT